MSLFDLMDNPTERARYADWRPMPLPPLRAMGVKRLCLDFETDGLRWDDGKLPGGFGLCFDDGTTQYHPYRHRGEPHQHSVEAVHAWFKQEMVGIEITNLNCRFDEHMAYADGVRLEDQGCMWSDVGHDAALLDDHRKEFSLASIVRDFLPEEAKVLEVGGVKLDPSRMMEYPAGMIAVRAEADARQVWKLRELFRPRLEAEDLMRVKVLENEVIFAVCEMERNGSPLDVPKLHLWCQQIEQDLLRALWKIHGETGLRINPNSALDWKKLFDCLKIPVTDTTATGLPTTTDEVLKRIAHPTVQLARKAGKLMDLQAKLQTLKKSVSSDGHLRYALHQLRTDKGSSEWDSYRGGAGTVSGRFSSTALFDGVGTSIQTVLACEKQIEKHGPDYIVRELFITEHPEDPEEEYLSSDAKQVEYRIFASKAANPKVLKGYEDDPDMSFHDKIHEMIKVLKPDMGYKPLKNLNFAEIYGAGLAKKALMMGYITSRQHNELRERYPKGVPSSEPLLREALAVKEIYDRELPETKALAYLASELAKSRGYVKTILGRRMRFPDGQRLHKALNGVIQGSAADVMKQKLVEIRRARIDGFTLRLTNHDELCGDAANKEVKEKVRAVLNSQSFPMLKVPILWDVDTAQHWAGCDKDWRKLKGAA